MDEKPKEVAWSETAGWHEPKDEKKSIGTQAGEYYYENKDWLNSPYRFLAESLTKSPSQALVTGGVGGALSGYLAGKALQGMSRRPRPSTLPNSILLGATGTAGLAYLLNRMSKKSAAFLGFDSDQKISSELSRDPSIGFSEENALMSMVDELDQNEKSQLAKLLDGAKGASAGFIIAKFLLDLGFTGQILFALAGGFLGNSSRSTNNLDSIQKDIYGNKFRN